MSKAAIDVVIRRLSSDDSLADLTALLHRAYKRLADMNLRYVATHQGVEVTVERAERGECYVATLCGAIVGSVAFEPADITEGCEYYDRPGVASFHQFAVEPDLQRRGIGSALLDVVERRARDTGATELALDTAVGADHLIAFYEGRGYAIVGDADWEDTNYPSVIMARPVGDGRRDQH